MHREIGDHVEDVLGGATPTHLAECEECRSELQVMREQNELIRELRPPENFVAEPRSNFYARVMERIEAQGPISIWNLFIESAFGRRIALASLALAMLIGVYLVTSERSADVPIMAALESRQVSPEQTPAQIVVAGEDAPAREITLMDQSASDQSSEDAVLANLVSYREQ